MSDGFGPASAASVLAEAWRSGALLRERPEAIRPRDMAEGCDVQDRLVAEPGQEVAGSRPGVGSAPPTHLHRAGSTVPLPNAAPVTVGFEIPRPLGRDVLPDEPAAAMLEAIREVRVAVELVLSRLTGRRAVGRPSFAADDAGFQALVPGGLAASLVVAAGGDGAAQRLTGEDATDPDAALADRVATARERSMVLASGSLVSTGTVSRFNVAAPSAEVGARVRGTERAFRARAGGDSAA